MVIVIIEEQSDSEIYVITWFAFVCFDIVVFYPIHLGLSVRLVI